jgi:hypothetical protein
LFDRRTYDRHELARADAQVDAAQLTRTLPVS